MAQILIIEDDPKLGPMLESSLQYAGYRVLLATQGRSGLETALNGSAQLIILDLMLPYVDGLHILKTMRRELINTPVIILTAKGTEAERLEGFRAGCDDYVSKPIDRDKLIAAIRGHLPEARAMEAGRNLESSVKGNEDLSGVREEPAISADGCDRAGVKAAEE